MKTGNAYLNGEKVQENIEIVANNEGKLVIPLNYEQLNQDTEYTIQSSVSENGKESKLSDPLIVKTEETVVNVASVAVAPKNATGTALTAEDKQFTAAVSPNNATNKSVSWKIEPITEGVTISNDGKASKTAAVQASVFTITATTEDGQKTDTGTWTIS